MTTSTADLWDERGADLNSIAVSFTDFGARHSFSGPARTVRCHEDNVLLRAELGTAGHGAVLVVDGGGSIASALLGDMIAQLAVDNGWAGIIINGAVRDRVALASMDIGIKALASNPRKSSKDGAGEVGIEVEIGGAKVRPGALVVADLDGVVIEQ